MSEETTPEQSKHPHPRRRPARRHRLFEIIIALGVLLISAVSVFVAHNANRTQERILAASVWPSLVFGTSNASADGLPQISLDLLNRGVGPARIRWAEVSYQDRPMAGPSSLLTACCGAAESDPDLRVVKTAIQRRVVSSNEWIQFMRVRPVDASPPVYEALDESLRDLRMRLCYCSALEECWILDSKLSEPTGVRECPAAPKVLWESGS